MKTPILALAAAVTLSACSRNPDPEYAADSDRTTRVDTIAATAAIAAPQAAPAEVARLSDAEAMRLGREAAQLIFAQDMDALWPRFDADVQAQAQSPENFGALMQQVFTQIGEETNLVEEEIIVPPQQPGITVYRRQGHYMGIGGDANLIVAFNADGSIAGVNIQPVM